MRSRLLEINEVLQVGEDKEEVRAVDVVEVAMIGRAGGVALSASLRCVKVMRSGN